MANSDKARGFVYQGRFSDESPPVHDFEMAASTTLSPGDPVTFASGYVTKAVSGNSILGVFQGPAAVDGDVNSSSSAVTSGAGEHPVVKVILALADVLFRVQDQAAAPTIALKGSAVDFAGTTGIVEVNSGTTTNGDVRLVDKAEQDDINGNAYGANMDWLVTFLDRVLG